MSITLTGTYTSTYVLSNSTTQNPATVASTGLVTVNSTLAGAAGILGTSGFAWTISNLGTVESVGNQGRGIDLQSGGTISNGQTASIYGARVGIALSAGGQVNNGVSATSTALISSFSYGIQTSAGATTVTNFGTVYGGLVGIQFNGGGVIVNQLGGLVHGGTTGLGDYVFSAVGATISNSGTVTGGSNGVFFAGAMDLTNTGLIAATGSAGTGVQLGGATATVRNLGTIVGKQGIQMGSAAKSPMAPGVSPLH